MSDLQRHIVTLDATDTAPDGAATTPFDGSTNATTAMKLGQPDGLDEETRTGTDALGRPISGGQTLKVEYFVRDNPDGTADAFVSFCRNQDAPIWVLETYQEHTDGGGTVSRLIGAVDDGCTVTTRTSEDDSMPGTIVTITSTSVVEGGNYRTEPIYQ